MTNRLSVYIHKDTPAYGHHVYMLQYNVKHSYTEACNKYAIRITNGLYFI